MIHTIAINCAKLVASLIKSLNLGQASSLPGRVALALNPRILEEFSAEIESRADETNLAFFVTGTNGKTTTTGLLKQIALEHKKLEVIANDFGANLYYGICSQLVQSTDLSGKLRSVDYVLELDEATLPKVTPILSPKLITVTNIYRDQLDRFGELETTRDLIVEGVSKCSAALVLNADDAKVAEIADLSKASKVIFYAVKYADSIKAQEIENFDTQSKSNIEPDIIIEIQEEAIGFSRIKVIKADYISDEIGLKLPGLYNVYNAAAAIASAAAAGIPIETIKAGLENYKVAFGRSEEKEFKGKPYQTFLIKNPTGCSEVLRYLSKDDKARFLIAINDNYADGRDVSWLWDAKFEYLKSLDSEIYCSGVRAEDMALRLKYAGLDDKKIIVEKNLKQALDIASKEEEKLYVLPTYTALLELNKI